MNRPPRRVRSPPPFGGGGHDSRAMARGSDIRLPPDYDDPYMPATPFEPTQSAPGAPFLDHHPHQPLQQQQYPVGFREHRLPSSYRSREPAYGNVGSSAPYKILCITNINPKVSDGPIKEALSGDFNRFGDISVSICHDSGERLAYIYFRTYEEAREARHAKARTLLFDRPIEIEPIYEPRSSPTDSPPPPQPQPPPPQTVYGRRRSITPPDYYGVHSPPPQPLPHSASRRPPPPPPMHHRGLSPPPPNYSHSSRYPPGPNHSMPPAPPMPYGRYYMQPPAHLPPPSPYSSPPHESYRSYHQHPPMPHPNHFPPSGHSAGSYPPHPHHFGPPPSHMGRDRDRAIAEGHMGDSRSPRHEPYPPYPIDHRGYPPPPPQHPPPPALAQHLSRSSSSLHSSSSSHHHHSSSMHPGMSPNVHHQSRHTPPHPPEHPRYMSREFRREKYSSETYSNEPEEGRPSRVLFINNIDSSKTELDLRDVFDNFGMIEEIELKKITPDMSSALIKFSSMDCAYKAKTATNGKYLGSLKCRISYGKVSASRRLWIGGFGPNTTSACLEDEFGKFGNIIHLDYISGRPYAYIEFESANQAQFATHHLKGTFVAEAERRLRIEYVDPVVERIDKTPKFDSSLQVSDISSRSRTTNESWSTNDQDTSLQMNSNRKRSITPTEAASAKRPHLTSSGTTGTTMNAKYTQPPESDQNRSGSAAAVAVAATNAQTSKVPVQSNSTSPPHTINDNKNELNNNQDSIIEGEEQSLLEVKVTGKSPSEIPLGLERLAQSKSIRDIVDCCSVSWLSQLVLRNFNFPSKMFMCSGRKATIDRYLSRLNGENGDHQCPVLRITQRWRLHPQPKLEEVKRRMQSGNLGMFIITSRPDQSPNFSSPSCKTPQSSTSQSGSRQNGEINEGGEASADEKTSGLQGESSPTQSRPLKNLISYLEQKDAAGVISLNTTEIGDNNETTETDGSKLLYAFPPGDFALNLLKRKAPNLTPDSNKEEFLLGVIVGGSETKI